MATLHYYTIQANSGETATFSLLYLDTFAAKNGDGKQKNEN